MTITEVDRAVAEQWGRERVSQLCALGDARILGSLAETLTRGARSVVSLQEPRTEMVLMECADPVTGGSFYVGEVLATTALVELDGVLGCAVVLGDEPDRARAAAVIDAARQRPGLVAESLFEVLTEVEHRISHTDQLRWALTSRTQVHFETMEDRDPGAARS